MGSMSQSLFAWVATLAPYEGRTQPKAEDFRDGIMTAKILKEVIDPDFFQDLKTSPNDSTPLIQVLKRMRQYLSEQVGHTIPNSLAPNIRGIMTSGDVKEISRLLQLLLGCAINSPRREEFVNKIVTMEARVQTVIMTAIQELMDAREEDTNSADVIELQLKKAREEIQALQETKDQLSQQCHDLQKDKSQMKVEKAALIAENEHLREQLDGVNDPESIPILIKIQEECRREIEQLREKNFELEALVDNYKDRNQVLEKQISETHEKMASAASAVEELIRLKDEMDSLKEAAAKTEQYEKQMKQYQKKLEEMADLKQNLKLFGEKNDELMRTNYHLTEENKKINSYKQQQESVNKELAEMQQRLSQETQKAIKANSDYNRTLGKLETAQAQIQTLQVEKTRMSEMLEELRLTGCVPSDGNMTNMSIQNSCVDSIELLPPIIRQKLVRLELENKKLHEELKTATDRDPSHQGSKVLVEQLRKHEEELDKELLAKNQELIDLRASYDDRIKKLEVQVLAKEEELRKKELQYKKCMEKAKSVIVTLEPTAAAGLDVGKSDEMEKARAVREMEEKLLASAFYNYGLSLHRNAVEARNTTLLQRQRTNVSRRKNL